MFPEGSNEPYDRMRCLIERLAAPLNSVPFRISITGHTSAGRLPAQIRLRALGAFGRSRQCGPEDARGQWRADLAVLS